MNAQMNHAKEPSPVAELIVDVPVHGVTPTTNANNLSAVCRESKSTIEESVAIFTKF